MSSQKRIEFDEFKRNVSSNRDCANYESALFQIQRNSSSRSLSKRLVQEQKERDIEDGLRKVQEEVERRNAQLILDQEAAQERATRVRELYHERKMRQQVRENNQELRILESQLRTAYVSKALAAQKREREAMALAEKIQDKEENEILEKARLSHIEQMRKEHEIDREKKKQLHKDLTKQIISAHQQHQRLYEEFLREKYYLDEIAQRVKEELIELAQKKIEIKEKTKKEMDAFRLVKKELERVEKIETEEENIRIFEYCQQRDQKIADEEKRCQELEKNRKNLNEKMVAELTELEERKTEREKLLQELWEFEQNEKSEEKIREQLEYRFRVRVETRLALEDQMIDQHRRKQLEAQEDRLFREKQLELLAERDKLDQLSDEKRRRKMSEHRKAIHEMLEERKVQRAEKLEEEFKLRDIEKEQEKRKQEIVEEERIKIIQEHAEALMGYLPAGVLRESDRKHLPMAPKK